MKGWCVFVLIVILLGIIGHLEFLDHQRGYL